MSVSAIAAIARRQWDRRSLHARCSTKKALTVEGETARYASSEVLDRVFCKICGTRLFAWRKKPAVAGVALAAFDDRNAFTPTDHMWVTEKMEWVRLDDGLPQYPWTAP